MRDPVRLKAIGERMREARDLAAYSQIKAAKKMGYRNSSRLNKIECGTDVSSISVDTIIKAANIYNVSTDFLLGLSDDWERDAKIAQEIDISKYLVHLFTSLHMCDINAIRQLNNRMSVLSHSVQVYDEHVKECCIAIKRFSELNPTFETEMRGGSRLLNAIHNAEHAVYNAKALMRRFKSDCKMAGGNTMQLGVFSAID